MMLLGAAPLGEQSAIVVAGPPVMVALVRFMSRGRAASVPGVWASDRTKLGPKVDFWVVLAVMYLLGFGMALYARLT